MANHHRLDPNPDNPTKLFTLRITEDDHRGLRELARTENRQPTAQLRHLLQQAVKLTANPPPEKKAPK